MPTDPDNEFRKQLLTELRSLKRAVLTLAAAQLRAGHVVEEDNKAKDRVKALWGYIGSERELS